MRILFFNTLAVALTLPIALSACAGGPAASAPASAPSSGPCNAAPAQFAVDRNANAALEEEARTRAGAKTVRVLKPGQMVTMEFNAERLSLTVDDAGRVTRVSCG
jgi:hypothetical protein